MHGPFLSIHEFYLEIYLATFDAAILKNMLLKIVSDSFLEIFHSSMAQRCLIWFISGDLLSHGSFLVPY